MRKIKSKKFKHAKYFLILLFVLMNACSSSQSIPVVYHPYLSKKLCEFTITGKLDSIQSLSFPLDDSNVFDRDSEDLDLNLVELSNDLEFYYPPINQSKSSYQNLIPCKTRYLRIRYISNSGLKILDLKLSNIKKQTFVLLEFKKGELQYEKE